MLKKLFKYLKQVASEDYPTMTCPNCGRETRVYEANNKNISKYPMYMMSCQCGYLGVWSEENGWEDYNEVIKRVGGC